MVSNFAWFGLSGGPGVVLGAVLLIILVFEVAMFISVIGNQQVTKNNKILWVLGMLLIHPFVAIAYYFTDYKKSA